MNRNRKKLRARHLLPAFIAHFPLVCSALACSETVWHLLPSSHKNFNLWKMALCSHSLLESTSRDGSKPARWGIARRALPAWMIWVV